MITSLNPYNQKVVYEFSELSTAQLEEKLKLAHSTFLSWRLGPMEERVECMRSVAGILRENKALYGKTITLEMGKPIAQSLAEIEKCAWVCEYYAQNAHRQLKDEIIKTDASKSYVRYEPLGPILAIMPWNFPFWQVFRFAAPNLMAGNVGLLKHASNVMRCAQVIEMIFEKAGFPKGCFQNLTIKSDKIPSILESDIVKAVTLTGSEGAGASVAATAGKNIKKSLLELGGNNALIVFRDADIQRTLEICVQARFLNTGQSCIAGKRLLIHSDIAEEFTQRLVEEVAQLKSGDPMDLETYIGVLAREDLARDLEKQVYASVAMGAKILVGGKRDKAFFEPTVLVQVTRDMPIFREETFGPVIGITVFKKDEEALALSNDSHFGLGVSLFTSNTKKIESLIPFFNEGAVFINELVKSDPRLPFGGVKLSGYGRELSSHGIREFVNAKTVYIS